LNPSCHLKHIRLWDEYFLYYSWLSRPRLSFSPKVIFEKDFYSHYAMKQKEINTKLQRKNLRLKSKLKDVAYSIEKLDQQSPSIEQKQSYVFENLPVEVVQNGEEKTETN